MNLVGYPLTCRLSWTWDVSSVLRASLEGMVFARCINVQKFIKILNISNETMLSRSDERKFLLRREA